MYMSYAFMYTVHDRSQGQDGLRRPSWNVQSDKDEGGGQPDGQVQQEVS
jgi:hypothetical protein